MQPIIGTEPSQPRSVDRLLHGGHLFAVQE